ncbi:polysaccharide deacetylase family protein [Myxococcota bacterium]|nr:polysaccharide deacetylase family protein [Myxococcota bacterium]
MSKPLKNLAGRLLFGMGLHRAVHGQNGLIVAFHRVNDQTRGDALSVGVEEFEAFCRFFERNYHVVSLGTLLDRMERGQSLRRHLVITFDDGYRDNFEHAAPVLRRLGLPATFFVVSRFIESEEVPHWDVGIEPRLPWMSWEQVQELAEQGFEIGGHTRTHVDLGKVTGEAAKQEILGGRRELEARLGRAVDLFAHPYGRESAMTEANRQLIAESGFRCNVSCHGGSVSPTSDAYSLRRVPINDWFQTPYQFGLEALLERV